MYLLEVRPYFEIDGIPRHWELVFRLQDAGSLETRIDLLEPPEASDEKTRTDHQQNGHGNLGHDESRPKTMPAAAHRASRITFALQAGLQANAAGLQRRKHSEEQSD